MDRTVFQKGWHMRVAALDVGTNTSDLIIIEKDSKEGTFEIVLEDERFIKLGEGVDENNVLLDSAMDRALLEIQHQVEIARSHGADEIRVAATSASRDAVNASKFAERVQEEVQVSYRVISGNEEATFTYDGAVSCIQSLPSEVLVFDIGGGSTEFCWGRGEIGGSLDQTSLQIGAVRLSEKYFTELPPPLREQEASRDYVDTQLLPWIDRLSGSECLIGSAGSTPAKLAALIELEKPVHGHKGRDTVVDYETVSRWESKVSKMNETDILKVQEGALKGREQYFLSGIIVLESIMRNFSFDNFLVSKGGVALGVALAKNWQ